MVKRHKLKDIGQVLKGALEYLTGSVGEELFNMVLIKNAKIKQEELLVLGVASCWFQEPQLFLWMKLVKLSSKVINCKAPGAPALISFLHFIEVGRLVLIIAIDGISITITVGLIVYVDVCFFQSPL